MGWSAEDINNATLWELKHLFKGHQRRLEMENGGGADKPPSKAEYEREKARVAALTS